MRFDGFPLRSLVILILTLSCPILALAAPVSRETIERLAEMNVERGEIRHLNAIGKLTDKEYYARLKTIDSEGATLWEPHNQTFEITREELRQAQYTITGLTRAKISLLEPRWEKEQTEFQEARRRQKEQIGIELEKDTRTAADFQRQRLLLQRQLDKGAIDRDSFTIKDREAQNGIAALRKKFEVAGGSYPRRFDERLTLLTKALADNPDTVLPRSQVPATVEGQGTGKGGEPDFNSDVKLAAELLANSEEIAWKFEKKQVSSDTFRETAKVYNHDLSRLRARYDTIKRGDQFEAAYTRLAAPAIQAIRVKYQPEKYRPAAPTTSTQRPPPPDFTLYYWLGGGGLLIVIFWLASLGKKEQAPAGPTPTDIHGTAHWAAYEATPSTHTDISRGVTFGKSSLPGYHLNAPGAPITSRPETHTLVVARTGAGKGTCVIMPTLLRYASSMLVIDPKGENAAVTARARRDQLKQDIQILNPWGVLKNHYSKLGFETATFNPFDVLDRNDPNITTTARTLAATISPVTDLDKPLWQGSAAKLLTGILLWLTHQDGLPRKDDPSQKETKTLARVKEIISLQKPDFHKILVQMLASNAFHGGIKEAVGQAGDSSAADTYGGILYNLQQSLEFIDGQIKTSTATSSISMDKLSDGSLTVYVVIPFKLMRTHSPWLRLVISSAMQALITSKDSGSGKTFHRCMFMIDEFGSMGHIPDIDSDLAQMRGYGMDFTLILQGLNQLTKHYGKAKDTILSQCTYQYFCDVRDPESAKYLSEFLGKKTVVTVSTGKTTGATQAGQTEGSSTTYGETGRSLLNPDEILHLGNKTAILLNPDTRPHYLHPIDYRQLTSAYQNLKDTHPHLYWNPPLTYDPNPLINNPPKPPIKPPNVSPSGTPHWFADMFNKKIPPPKPPPMTFEDMLSPENRDDLRRISQQIHDDIENKRKTEKTTPPPPPKTLEDFVSKESLEDFKRAIREKGGVFPPPPEEEAQKPDNPGGSRKRSEFTPEQIAAVMRAKAKERKWKPKSGSFDLNEPDDPPPPQKPTPPK